MDYRHAAATDALKTDCRVLPLPEGEAASAALAELPESVRTPVEQARKRGDFSGKLGSTLLLIPTDGGDLAARLLLVGTGKDALNDKALKKCWARSSAA